MRRERGAIKKASPRYAVTSLTGKMVGECLNVKVLFPDYS